MKNRFSLRFACLTLIPYSITAILGFVAAAAVDWKFYALHGIIISVLIYFNWAFGPLFKNKD